MCQRAQSSILQPHALSSLHHSFSSMESPKAGPTEPFREAMPSSQAVAPCHRLLTCGGAEGCLILEIAVLCHLGVAGFILACFRVWGGGRAGSEGAGTEGQQTKVPDLADPLAPGAEEQYLGSAGVEGITVKYQQTASRERQDQGWEGPTGQRQGTADKVGRSSIS